MAAKVNIKSEEITPLGEIFSIMEQFDSTLSSVIDSTLSLRCGSFHFMALFSRHGITRTSSVLLIWLNENVGLSVQRNHPFSHEYLLLWCLMYPRMSLLI